MLNMLNMISFNWASSIMQTVELWNVERVNVRIMSPR